MKIQLKKLEEITIKYNKQPIKIRPYISRASMIALTQIALDNYFVDTENLKIDRFAIISQVKVGYDIAVISSCTDLDVSGVEIEDFVASGIIDIIAPHISNYQSTWELIARAISDRVLYDGLGLIAKAVPSDKNMNKSVENISTALKEIGKHPEIVGEMVRVSQINTADKIAKETVQKSKSKVKNEPTQKKG
jgi:hypothetical protein